MSQSSAFLHRMIVNLLKTAPLSRAAQDALKTTLTFAFARGVMESELIARTLPNTSHRSERERLPSSQLFESDLFLKEFVELVSGAAHRGRREKFSHRSLDRLLRTPVGREARHTRQNILRVLLDDSPLREAFEKVYRQLVQLRASLTDELTLNSPTAALKRRVDILSELRSSIDALSAFDDLPSELGALGSWSKEVQASAAYGELAGLLDFEKSRVELQTNLQLGYDGTLRNFEIVQVSERQHAALPDSYFAKKWRRLVSFLRGYRYQEDDVLSQLLDACFQSLEAEVALLLQVIPQFEFYLAAFEFRRAAQEEGLKVCLPEFCEDALPGRQLNGLFNPWLLGSGRPIIPADLCQAPAARTVVLTGPNSGGKTRLLQSIALTQILGQVGFFVPAARADLVEVESIFLSLQERPEANQKEGRLGSEMLRIRKVFESCGPRSLIILDELCSGTNPSEGGEIFEMVLELLRELKPQAFVSTHFLDLAQAIETKEMKLENRQRGGLDFLQVELSEGQAPTYQFVPGVASTSLARATAARLGVGKEELMQLVLGRVAQEER
ncbi:MAG: DNA mismatch repair protein [Polyangiaceae bacterium]|nr:DNA mismatch repair protein [Polyangiaceae bacterium]